MKNIYNEEQQNNFVRIAEAQIKSIFPYGPLRRAWAAKMYGEWINRKKN